MAGSLERAWRDERARLVGSLARRFGDLGLAEDAVQEAFVAAATRWPIDGEPDQPGAWLNTTAYRKAVGLARRRRPTSELDDADDPSDPVATLGDPPVTDDDLFALVLTCCHPALNAEARSALTLRHVCGLSVGQIAAAFVVPEPTMAKRLVRAREKIRRTGISFEPPDGADLDARVDDVRTVIYVVFTEGYLASDDRPAIGGELCDEAIWLARHLRDLRPDDETTGLLTLLLTQNARRSARQDPSGRLVPLPEQDRSQWDHEAVAEARRLLGTTSGRSVGRYQVEAAIAVLHVTAGEPDWARIADLYGVLSRLSPSPIVEVNRALAVGYADGPQAGFAILDPVIATGRLDAYAPMHAVRAELLARAGHDVAAIESWVRGAEASDNPSQRAAMLERADELRHRA